MSRIYKHGHYPSELTMDNVNSIVDIIETYLCNYKLGFHLVYQRTHLIRMDIYKLNTKSLIHLSLILYLYLNERYYKALFHLNK